MKQAIRRRAAVLLILYAAALGLGGVAYQLRPDPVGAPASPTARLDALEPLRAGLRGVDTVGYRLCTPPPATDAPDSSVVLSHYYLAQYALAPALVDTSAGPSAHAYTIADVPSSCEAGTEPAAVIRLETGPR